MAAAISSSPSGDSSSASSGWVSGSPNRALNSMTRTPREVSASPAYSSPENGVPRRASSSTVGCSTVASTSSTRPGGAHGSGV